MSVQGGLCNGTLRRNLSRQKAALYLAAQSCACLIVALGHAGDSLMMSAHPGKRRLLPASLESEA